MGNVRLRDPNPEGYKELLLVGHSLGSVIVRRMLCDVAHDWHMRLKTDPSAARPPLLAGQLRLFSPASAGFRPSKTLGLLRASPAWLAVNLHLRRSSSYSDLQPGSLVLTETRRRTEELVDAHDELDSLRAHILWANPDGVVIAERYDSDYLDDALDGKSHRAVCKPNSAYQAPWTMVETGRPY